MSENKGNPQNPAGSDLREMEILRFLFELKREQLDPTKIQEMLIERKIQEQVRALAAISYNRDTPSPSSSSSYASTPTSSRSNDDVPNPNVIFKYASSEPSTPVPIFQNQSKSPDSFQIQDRCQFINMSLPPTPSTASSPDLDQENLHKNPQLPKPSAKVGNWGGASIYEGLPERALTEFDKLLRESHALKIEVVDALNQEFPINYEYNPKKSRIRTDYNDPRIADDRSRNNVASRRSRQRKKFQLHMMQYSVDYDTDENFLMEKQETWLQGMIGNLEKRLKTEKNGSDAIEKLRKQCGLNWVLS